jgi:hypothetical protein
MEHDCYSIHDFPGLANSEPEVFFDNLLNQGILRDTYKNNHKVEIVDTTCKCNTCPYTGSGACDVCNDAPDIWF